MPEVSGATPVRNWFQRAMGEAVDRVFLANRGHDFKSGNWDGRGAMQGGIQSVLGAINPALGLGARFVINRMNANQGGQMAIEPTRFQTSPGFVPSGGANAPLSMGGTSVQGQATPWAGLGTSTGNVVNGGPLGSWANQMRPVNPYAYGNGNTQSNGGARGYRGGGITGEAAKAMMDGMSMQSRFNTYMTDGGPVAA